MRKLLIATLVSVAALSGAGMAAAAGRSGGPSTGVHGAAANSNGLKAVDRDLGQQRAADRAGSKSKTAFNSNGLRSSDRDKGKMRAADRRHRTHRSFHRK